jgi:two-component system, OmpR family, sensor histidine kinase CiaH
MRRDPGETEIRRVRWRLAILIVLLLCGLLAALGIGVYTTMRTALLQPAKQAASTRAHAQLSYLIELAREKPDSTEARDSSAEQEVGGVAITYLGPTLKILAGSSDPFGKSVPDPGAARRAVRTRSAIYSTRDFNSQSHLIYTLPAIKKGRVLGLLQTGISEQQYEKGLQALLWVLAIVGGLGLLASAGISVVVVRRALLPIRAAMRRQRDFVADAAHELRTPLSIMRTAAELNLAAGSPGEQQVALEQVLDQGNQLTRLVEDLSLLARADSGVLTMAYESVNLGRLTAETVDDLAVLAHEPGVRLEFPRPDTNVSVLGDEARLRQLLVILLDNALKHTPAGGLVLVSLESQGGRATLRVRDTGPGMASEDLPHVFERFYRAKRSRAEGDGAGLGLAIGRWIVEAHGGRIFAANEPGGGAVFTVSLPATV